MQNYMRARAGIRRRISIDKNEGTRPTCSVVLLNPQTTDVHLTPTEARHVGVGDEMNRGVASNPRQPLAHPTGGNLGDAAEMSNVKFFQRRLQGNRVECADALADLRVKDVLKVR
jgi:hypothetical protein